MIFFVNKNRKFKTLLILSFLFGFYANVNSGFLGSFFPLRGIFNTKIFKGLFKRKKVWSSKKLISNPVFLAASGGIILCAGFVFWFYVRGDGLDSNSIEMRKISRICYYGRVDDMERILDEGFNVNTVGEFGVSALHKACSMGRHDIVRLLVRRGANIDLADVAGRTPVHIFSSKGRDYVDAVEFLVDNGASIYKVDLFGRTPLHLALYHSYFRTVKFLVENGADVNIVDQRGKSCLDLAKEKCDQEFLKSVFKIRDGQSDKKTHVTGSDARIPDDNCSICLENLKSLAAVKDNGEICRTKCNHYFHKDCINAWLIENETCPNCRARQNKRFY